MRILAAHQHGKDWCEAFKAGADGHGDLLLCWGTRWRREINKHLANGGQVCVLECGYLGNRHEWASASMGGGLNGRGMFPLAQDSGERFKSRFRLEPWLRRDGYALLMGQVPGDMSLESVNGNLSAWYRAAAQMPDTVFRPHPKEAGVACPPGARLLVGRRRLGFSLAKHLEGARVAVTFNSNAGVDAILAGVPVIATDPGSMAWPVASHGFDEKLVRPRRDAWAARLAWCQWTMDEMASGAAWEALKTAEAYNTKAPSPFNPAAPWSACP